MVKRYLKGGLKKTSRRRGAFLEQRGLEGFTVLEVGGGVGEIQIELLERGAARTVNLELSPGYDEEGDCCASAVSKGVPSGACRTMRWNRKASSRPTSSCCTESCAATPITSACSARRPGTRGTRSSSAIRRATSCRARGSPRRTSC